MKSFSAALSMALLLGGCPHRQTAPRVVYAPSPPPRATKTTTAHATDALVIEEPPPPPPERQEEVPAEPSPPGRRVHHPAPGESPAATTPEPAPETATVPALEPRESPQQRATARNQILTLQQSLKQRLAQLEHANLSGAQRKTLEDARTFLAQSSQAFEEGDLQRSQVLADKAKFLVGALDQGH